MSCEAMEFPDDWTAFIQQYEFADKEEVYTNGSMLVPSFRVGQMVEHYFGGGEREGLIDTWKLRKLASTAQGFAECDPRLNGREVLFESAEAMRKAASTIEALSAELARRVCDQVKRGTKPDGTPRWRCSICDYGLGDDRWSYCPKCGAKVRKAVRR